MEGKQNCMKGPLLPIFKNKRSMSICVCNAIYESTKILEVRSGCPNIELKIDGLVSYLPHVDAHSSQGRWCYPLLTGDQTCYCLLPEEKNK